jgi:hypothetical protein
MENALFNVHSTELSVICCSEAKTIHTRWPKILENRIPQVLFN